MEVFFCSCPNSKERYDMAESCYAIWRAMDCELHYVTPETVGCSRFEFQMMRRVFADKQAKRDVYVLTDDDCVPYDIEKAIRALRSHPDFAIISLWPSNATINRWTPENYEPMEDLDVMEHYSVGGIRVCRKGAVLKGWPEQTGPGYDAEHCEALRACGWRCGYSQHARCVHIGEGKSSVWTSQSSSQAVAQL